MRWRALFLVFLPGTLILVALGVWQLQRLEWKKGILSDINTRIGQAPVALPATPDPALDTYLPVEVTGTLGADYLRVLVSKKGAGAGYRIIRPMTLDEGRILVDMGYIRTVDAEGLQFDPVKSTTVVGNLQWPQEVDGFTPAPDTGQNIWYARDVPAMAEALDTDPVLIVRREGVPGEAVAPMPVDTSAIPNDHLQYAVTWFSLAAIWTAMTVYFIRRKAPPGKG